MVLGQISPNSRRVTKLYTHEASSVPRVRSIESEESPRLPKASPSLSVKGSVEAVWSQGNSALLDLPEASSTELVPSAPPDSGIRPSPGGAAPSGRLARVASPFVEMDPQKTLTDRDLVERSKKGDQKAFGELVRRHHPRIQRLAIHMVRDRALAEDIAQEAFLRAFKALDRFDGRSEPYTWIYRIAVNLSLNAIRSRKSSRISGEDDDARLDAIRSDRPDGQDPQSQSVERQQYLVLCEGIDALSETLRTTLVLVCIDGVSHEDAATILGAPEGTIAWRVHEARRKLKDFMESRGFGAETPSEALRGAQK